VSGFDDVTCCRRCEDAALAKAAAADPLAMLHRKFIVCTTCGNKRCPKATNHELACTGSNATGQPGSDYE
jgi:hypothetical protein